MARNKLEAEKKPNSAQRTSGDSDMENDVYDNLIEKVLSRNNLNDAYRRVKRNKGVPGIDGMTVDELGPYLREHRQEIKEAIRAGKYKEAPVKRVEIPKPDGSKRQLGIPTVRDRFVQQAVAQVLTPIYEQVFSDNSFGFRPKRSAADAIERARGCFESGLEVVVDIDMRKFFDEVNHDKLMYFIEQRIKDKLVLRLIRRFLVSGIMDNGMFQPCEKGTPQGGPLSPLLANIYLHVLDSYWENHKELGVIVRYADDAVIVCRTRKDAELAFEHLKRIMTKLKLTLNPQKTKIVDMNKESFDFLGFRYQKFGKTKCGRKLPYMMPSKKAMKKVKDAIRVITCRKSAYEGLEQKVGKLNPLIRGWRNYFQHGNSTKRFKQLDEYVWMRLWRRVYYRRKQKKYREHVLYGFRKWYATSGIEYFYYLNKKRYVAVF